MKDCGNESENNQSVDINNLNIILYFIIRYPYLLFKTFRKTQVSSTKYPFFLIELTNNVWLLKLI